MGIFGSVGEAIGFMTRLPVWVLAPSCTDDCSSSMYWNPTSSISPTRTGTEAVSEVKQSKAMLAA
jgi:hypothetical protein